MTWVLPEVVIQKVITYGIKQLRADKAAFYDLFGQFIQDELALDYGTKYLDEVWDWFATTKIPVVKAWSFNAQIIPCISIHLANETEDESKASFGDLAGDFGELGEINTGVFTVMVDIGIHANKAGDHVLWLYYIVAYCLFKHKMMVERFGIKLHTFSASDYNKEAGKMTENIWTRWVRFKGTTQNFWGGQAASQIDDVNVEYTIGMDPSLTTGVAGSEDVDISSVDKTTNNGIKASRVDDFEDIEDLNI